MLCCVSKRAVAGADPGPPYDPSPPKIQPVELRKIKLDFCHVEDVPPILLPCAICARTFMPQSLEKHSKICERAAAKKRKPFDSAKQRIQGTDLAEFLPKQERKRHVYQEERFSKPKSSWKETHDDFIRAIRAARNEIVDTTTTTTTTQRQCGPQISNGAPTRANEQGTCPTCNRRFGIKAYDRHVAWCKERSTRVPLSPATNIAKERLEARMKYRAPALRNRRATNREKYSPGSSVAVNTGCKTSTGLSVPKAKESASVPNCNKGNDSPVKQRPAVVRRAGQVKESGSSGPMKSRPIDRNRPAEDEPTPISSRPLPSVKRTSYFSVPPLKPRKESIEESRSDWSSTLSKNVHRRAERNVSICHRGKEDAKCQTRSARSPRTNIVSARSQGNPKVNDVSVNAEIVGMIVQPCTIHGENELVTWKQIGRERKVKNCDSWDFRFLETENRDTSEFKFEEEEVLEEYAVQSVQSTKEEEDFVLEEKKCEGDGCEKEVEKEVEYWPGLKGIEKLNRTYLVKDVVRDDDYENLLKSKGRKPVSHSPRVEFYVKNTEFDFLSENEGDRVAQRRDSFERMTEVRCTLEDEHLSDCDSVSKTEERSVEVEKERGFVKSNDEVGLSNLERDFDEIGNEELFTEVIRPTRSSTPLDTSPVEESNQSRVEEKMSSCDCDLDCRKDSPKNYNSKIDVLTLNDLSVNVDEQSEEESISKKEIEETSEQKNVVELAPKSPEDEKFDEILKKRCGSYVLEKKMRSTSNESISSPRKFQEAQEDQKNCEECHNTSMDSHNSRSKTFVESIIETDNTLDDEVQQIYENYTSRNFDYDSDDTMDEQTRRNLKTEFDSPPQNYRTVDTNIFRPTISANARVKSKGPDASFYRSNRKTADLKNRFHQSTYSHDATSEFLNNTQGETVEVETIEEIGTRNRSIRYRILPEIRGTSVVIEENYERRQRVDSQTYWERASKATKNRLINLDPPNQRESRLPKRNPKIRVLPPVPSSSSLRRSGTCKDYDPFLLAEQQMNELLSDTSDQSVTDGPSIKENRENLFPLSHSSAFVKYPFQATSATNPDKRTSLIAPPTEFDDLTSDFSSDSTETNSLSREVFLKDLRESKDLKDSISKPIEKKSPNRELGRRVIIDKSKALGGEVLEDSGNRGSRSFVGSSERARKILDRVSPKVVRPSVNRSQSVRASSAPKSTPDRKISSNPGSGVKKGLNCKSNETQKMSSTSLNNNNRNNNYVSLSGSNLSLSSIVSSEADIKRSNSVFDELMTSFEEENEFPSLRYLLKTDSLSVSSPNHGGNLPRNGRISDEELSSPESYKRQDHGKLSADSAYSSLNRKYSNHGRSTNDVAGRLDEDQPRKNRRDSDTTSTPATKYKMSKFCHECGFKFLETAKFCCQCGIKRLAL